MVLIPRYSVPSVTAPFFLATVAISGAAESSRLRSSMEFSRFALPPFADGFASAPTGATINPGDVEH